MFKVLKNKDWGLKKVTPKAVKMYQEMIRKSADDMDELEKDGSITASMRASVKSLDLFLDIEQMYPWAEVVFNCSEEDLAEFKKAVPLEEYDYEEYIRGFQSFLAKLSPLANGVLN